MEDAIREYSAGKIEFRNDKGGNVHAVVGKLSFTETQLLENINAFLNHLRSLKPATAKGTYIRSITDLGDHEPGHPGLGLTAPPLSRPRPALRQATPVRMRNYEQVRQRIDDGSAPDGPRRGAVRS